LSAMCAARCALAASAVVGAAGSDAVAEGAGGRML
jgi:hypothetical protein